MKNRPHRQLLYIILRLLGGVVILLPFRLASGLGQVVGDAAFWLLRRQRQRTIENLNFALGKDKSSREINCLAGKVFENLGRNLTEILSFPRLNKDNIDRYVTSEGWERIDQALQAGRGVIIIAPHFGNWELMALYGALKGYDLSVVARRIYYDKFDQLLNSLRRAKGIKVIYRDDSVRKLLAALKNNQLLGILPDQDVDSVEGVFVDFFSQPAYTPSGPVALAMASGAAVIPCFMIREGHRHRFIVEEPITLEVTGDREQDIKINTQRWSEVVESYIRRWPDQWVWMHQRWKTRPEK